MPTAESVKAKLQSLINQANATTGSGDADLTTAVGSLIAGFGQGGGGFPEKFYETDFAVDADFTANGAICTLSTGLSDNRVSEGNELLLARITCEPAEEPTGNWVPVLMQFINPNQGAAQIKTFIYYGVKHGPMEHESDYSRRSEATGVSAYLYSATSDLSTLTVYGRFNIVGPIVGTYHLELYRLGVTV